MTVAYISSSIQTLNSFGDAPKYLGIQTRCWYKFTYDGEVREFVYATKSSSFPHFFPCASHLTTSKEIRPWCTRGMTII